LFLPGVTTPNENFWNSDEKMDAYTIETEFLLKPFSTSLVLDRVQEEQMHYCYVYSTTVKRASWKSIRKNVENDSGKAAMIIT
jgi:hypothetical protein